MRIDFKMRKITSTLKINKARGISLIEVLVAILLAAISLMVLIGSNLAAIRYSKMSQYRATATMLASDLGERMRANKAGLASYAYTSDFATQSPAIPADTACEGYATSCLPAALAAHDVLVWRRIVRSQLPEGSVFLSAQIAQNAMNGWIAWRDPAVADADENNTDSRNIATECPPGLSLGADKSVRCSFFRINL